MTASVGNATSIDIQSYSTIARNLCLNRFETVPQADGKYHWGFGGYTADDIIANDIHTNVIAATGNETDAVFVFIGANDCTRGGATGQSVAADVVALWDLLLAGGVQVIGCEIIPHAENEYAAIKAIANPLLRDAASTRGMHFMQWADAIDTPVDDFNMAVDNVHPSVIGHFKLGVRLAESLNRWLSPYAKRTGFVSSNSSLGGATSGNSWIPTGFSIAGTATRSSQGYVAASDGGGSWLEYTITTAGADGAIQLTCPAVSSFPGSFYRASGEIQVDVLTGELFQSESFPSYNCYLREVGFAFGYADALCSTAQGAKWNGAEYSPQWPHIRTESKWAPKNASGTWTSLTAAFLIQLKANSSARVRFRNLGIESK